jgi:hypothetical protein
MSQTYRHTHTHTHTHLQTGAVDAGALNRVDHIVNVVLGGAERDVCVVDAVFLEHALNLLLVDVGQLVDALGWCCSGNVHHDFIYYRE